MSGRTLHAKQYGPTERFPSWFILSGNWFTRWRERGLVKRLNTILLETWLIVDQPAGGFIKYEKAFTADELAAIRKLWEDTHTGIRPSSPRDKMANLVRLSECKKRSDGSWVATARVVKHPLFTYSGYGDTKYLALDSLCICLEQLDYEISWNVWPSENVNSVVVLDRISRLW